MSKAILVMDNMPIRCADCSIRVSIARKGEIVTFCNCYYENNK